MDDCIFCKIVAGEIPSFKIYEDPRVLAFADIHPISRGHTLIIPKGHYENLWELPEQDLMAVQRAAKTVAEAIRRALSPAGIACLQLNGTAVNQVVMHYHFHLIPRSGDEPELTMTAWEMVPGDMDTIRQTSETIAAAVP